MAKLGFELSNHLFTADFPEPDIEHLATLLVVVWWINHLHQKGKLHKDSEGRLLVASYPGK